MVAPCVLCILRAAVATLASTAATSSMDQQLVALQMVVEVDLLVGGEIAVSTLVFLLEQMIWVVFHVALEEAS